jgi:regulator of replication initiation timing
MTSNNTTLATGNDQEVNKDYSSLFQDFFAEEFAVMEQETTSPSGAYPSLSPSSSTSTAVTSTPSFPFISEDTANPNAGFVDFLKNDLEQLAVTPLSLQNMAYDIPVSSGASIPAVVSMDQLSLPQPSSIQNFWSQPTPYTPTTSASQPAVYAPLLPRPNLSNPSPSSKKISKGPVPKVTELPQDEKRMKNILSSRKFRQRRREYLSGLEAEVIALRKQVKELSETVSSSQKDNNNLRKEVQQLRDENFAVKGSFNLLKRRFTEAINDSVGMDFQKKFCQPQLHRTQSDINPAPSNGYLTQQDVHNFLRRSQSDLAGIVGQPFKQPEVAVYTLHQEDVMEQASNVFRELYDSQTTKEASFVKCENNLKATSTPVANCEPLMWSIDDIPVETQLLLPGAA